LTVVMRTYCVFVYSVRVDVPMVYTTL